MSSRPRTVFLLGAGSTISHSRKIYPDIRGIFKKARKLGFTVTKTETIKPEFLELDEFLQSSFNCSLLDRNKPLDFEKVFTFIDIEMEKDQLKFGGLRRQLIQILIDVFMKLKNDFENKIMSLDNTEYAFLAQKSEPEDSIISFNWDVLLDDACGREYLVATQEKNAGLTADSDEKSNRKKDKIDLGKKCGGGQLYEDFVLSRFSNSSSYDKPLYLRRGHFLKLHGSVDWKICRNRLCSKYNFALPRTFPLTKEKCPYCLETLDTLIIPPTLQKSINQVPLVRNIWNIAAHDLTQASRIVIWGYSLPATDFHAEWLLRKAIANGNAREVIVINRCDEHIKKFRKLFSKVRSNNFKTYEDFSEFRRGFRSQ